MDQITGDVNTTTSTGAIAVNKVRGFVRAVTNTGNIKVTEIGGLFEASTQTGKVFTEVPSIRDKAVIKSSCGSIVVLLAPHLEVELEASTDNGEVTYTDLPLTITSLSKTFLSGKIGSGRGGKVNVQTSTGSVSLKKLAVLSAIVN